MLEAPDFTQILHLALLLIFKIFFDFFLILSCHSPLYMHFQYVVIFSQSRLKFRVPKKIFFYPRDVINDGETRALLALLV